MSRRRIRTIKPEFFEDEKICAISRDARLVAIGLITLADDRGRLRYKPLAILGDVFPEEAVQLKQLRSWIEEITAIGLAIVYTAAQNEYLWLPRFLRHQVINRPTESVLPAHPDDPWAQMPIREAIKAAKLREELPENSGSSPVDATETSSPTRGSVPFRSVPTGFQGNRSLTREIVDDAITILQSRWELVDPVAVENAASMYPTVDVLQGCRLAVTWASDPTWEVDSAAASLRVALRKLDGERPEHDEKATRRTRRTAALKSVMDGAG